MAQTSHGKTVFFVGLLLAASGVVSPAIALAGGIAFGFTVEHPFRAESSSLAKLLLQASVVALGFGMNLRQVMHAGRSGFLYTAVSISCAMLLGLLFGSLLKVAGKASFLISAGTAICGGSAIAAVAPITGADQEEISVSMGTIFLLNSVALLIFPAIGHAPPFEPESIRALVRSCHPRHQLRRRSCGEIRKSGVGCGHHRKTGTCFMDRSRLAAYGGLYGKISQRTRANLHPC